MSQTKSSEEDMKKLFKRLDFDNMDVILAVGSAGDLALLWKDSIDLCVLNRDKCSFIV